MTRGYRAVIRVLRKKAEMSKPKITKISVTRGRIDYECNGRKFILYNEMDLYFVDEAEGEGVLQQLVFNPDHETPEDVILDYL